MTTIDADVAQAMIETSSGYHVLLSQEGFDIFLGNGWIINAVAEATFDPKRPGLDALMTYTLSKALPPVEEQVLAVPPA